MEFFQPIIDWYMANMNYLTILILMAIESSFIPFPSEVVIPPAAWKAAQGDLNFWLVLFFGTLGALIPATGDKFDKAQKLGFNLQDVLDKKIALTSEQLTIFADNQIATEYPTFVGFTIHNLFEFFMVFVVLTGIASLILFALTPFLKKMMHGIR